MKKKKNEKKRLVEPKKKKRKKNLLRARDVDASQAPTASPAVVMVAI